jgi:hypothetical protein
MSPVGRREGSWDTYLFFSHQVSELRFLVIWTISSAVSHSLITP